MAIVQRFVVPLSLADHRGLNPSGIRSVVSSYWGVSTLRTQTAISLLPKQLREGIIEPCQRMAAVGAESATSGRQTSTFTYV